ncbi:hypothetical protein J6590_051708 [Homalodisca vitripennis]|nr:hypothetical protein J6590_051708 [Homalodisca vitripennis]
MEIYHHKKKKLFCRRCYQTKGAVSPVTSKFFSPTPSEEPSANLPHHRSVHQYSVVLGRSDDLSFRSTPKIIHTSTCALCRNSNKSEQLV